MSQKVTKCPLYPQNHHKGLEYLHPSQVLPRLDRWWYVEKAGGVGGGVGGGNRQEGALTIEQLQQQVYAKNGDNHVYIS
jgi:hypothetical protein